MFMFFNCETYGTAVLVIDTVIGIGYLLLQ